MRRLLALTLIATVTACSSESSTGPDRPITAVTITPGTASIVVGQTVQLVAAITGGFSNPIVTWSSSNTSVATVTDSGTIVAKALGSTTISAKAGSITGTATITVITGVTGVTVTPATTALVVGQSSQLSATVSGSYLQPPTLTWASSNSAIASVDATGRITAKAAGTATISAVAAGVSGSTAVTVTNGTIDRVAVCSLADVVSCSSAANLSAIGTSTTARASAFNSLGADITASCIFTWTPSAAGVVSITFFGDATKRDALITRTGYGIISIIVSCGSVPGVFTVSGPTSAPVP